MSLFACGWSALALSDATGAERYFHDAIKLAWVLGWIRGVAWGASGLGTSLIVLHEVERGAQLVGAARSLFEEFGVGFDEELQEQICERAAAEGEAALGADAFAVAVARGAGMTLEEIVAFATA